AGAHRDHPFGFADLLVDALQDRHHLDRDTAGADQQVALSRAEAHDLGAEACQVVTARRGRHQLDAAAGGRERQGPQRVLAAPGDAVFPNEPDDFVQPRRDDVVAGHVVWVIYMFWQPSASTNSVITQDSLAPFIEES